MGNNNSVITLVGENNEEIHVEVIEQTIYDGKTYLLVADTVDGNEDGDCYILRENKIDGEDIEYEVVSEEEENILYEIFEKILSEDDIELKK